VCDGESPIIIMSSLSVYIMVQNEEKRVRTTLENIKDLADEIVVIDGGSTDRTVEVCREYTENIFVHAFEGYAKQRRYALTKVTGDWVLAIDSDETLSPELHDAVRVLISRDDADAYEFSRRNYVKPGIWLRYGGGYPDWQRRLFRRTKAAYGTIVHGGEVPVIDGKVQQLNLDIIHDQIGNNIQYSWSRLVRYARSEVRDTERRHSSGYYIVLAFFHFFLVLVKTYAIRGGYKMGFLGVRLALSRASLQFLVRMGLAVKRK
jgi:glycosyltransferase involved in cell wall biosynthesis